MQLFFALVVICILPIACTEASKHSFDSQLAMRYVVKLLSFGPRIPGSEGSQKTSEFIFNELSRNGWQVEFQEFSYDNVILRNIIARKNNNPPNKIIATHYDTRQISDQEKDSTLRVLPVPGANDGTSGTAVLLSIARNINENHSDVWIVFFDGEDQGNINLWEWSIGAKYFVDQLESYPQEAIIIDMIGDKDLNIYKEKFSTAELTGSIWEIAHDLGFNDNFIDSEKYALIDDHLPFINQGIPASLIIDFDYPFWHTQEDTIDKLSAKSLDLIGQVLLEWLLDN